MRNKIVLYDKVDKKEYIVFNIINNENGDFFECICKTGEYRLVDYTADIVGKYQVYYA